MGLWRINLFGGLQAEHGDETVERFATHKTGAILAFLALHSGRSLAREALTELFWPEADPEASRLSLRVALSALRRQLEPPGSARGDVLIADRTHVRLNPLAVTTDVAEFESGLQAAASAADAATRIFLLGEAVARYRGELLPGFYDEWVLDERQRLADACAGALRQLAGLLQDAGRMDDALDAAHRALALDPASEESHCVLMRLYAATGRPDAALRQFAHLERVLERDLGLAPSPATFALKGGIEEGIGGRAAPQPAVPRIFPSLPASFTRFFGREDELARMAQTLGRPGTRLLTLTGSGGSGKTRLAVEAARRLTEQYAGSVWFVSLDGLAEAHLMPARLLGTLGLTPAPGVDFFAQAAQHINHRPCLFVLDNMEQLVEEGAVLVQTLLARIPTLSCLVTSRQALGLEGEQVFPVSPLPVPGGGGTPESLQQIPSVQLFVDRAQTVRADFAVTEQNAEAVASLCARLEGIPLALELAAGWARTVTPAQMLAQLDRRFEFLVTRRRDASDRHRTLRAALEWSYHSLLPELQRFFVRLSVFRGGWTVEAARHVCDEPRAQDFLAQLEERSLLLTQETGDAMRFRLLETLREYADELLPPQDGDAARGRHVEFYLALAEESAKLLTESAHSGALLRLENDHDNLRAASDWCRQDSDRASTGLRLAGSLWGFWSMRWHLREGRDRLEFALSADDTRTLARAKAALGAGCLAYMQADYGASRAWLQESLTLAEDLDEQRLVAAAQLNLGNVAASQGDIELAAACYETCLATWREMGAQTSLCIVLHNLGDLSRVRGDYAAAHAFYGECVAIQRETGDVWGISNTLNSLALLACLEGHDEDARSCLLESAALLEADGDRLVAAETLEVTAILAARHAREEQAARLWGTAEAVRETLGTPMSPVLKTIYERELDAARARTHPTRWTAAWAIGRTTSLDAALVSVRDFPPMSSEVLKISGV